KSYYKSCGSQTLSSIGADGFEPATFWSQIRRATGLRYAPRGAMARTTKSPQLKKRCSIERGLGGSAQVRARTPEQSHVQRTADEHHLLDSRVDGDWLQLPVRPDLELELSGAPHQFLDEGRARALRAPDDYRQELVRHLQAAGIQLHQLGARRLVRKREFNGLVDATWSRGQRRLEFIRPVGRQNEDDVGVLAQPVHLIEQLVEEHFLARAAHVLAGSSDQVDVFDYYGGRLQKAGKPKILV